MISADSMTRRLQFHEFELDLDAYALVRRARPVRLERLPMEVLIFLVARAGTLVTRDEIRSGLWAPDVFVDHDAAINTAIRKIRRTLGDAAETPRFIETVVGKGYRFIAPVNASSTRLRRALPTYSLTRSRRKFVLATADTLLGRDPSAGVCIDHRSVSRRHARISIDAEGAVLSDLDSRNGTFLNGRRIDGPTRITHGAIIGLGPIVLTFVVAGTPASTRSVS
jgi:DNA-binding winged helix-turn-helix (wHTH) protein